MTWQLDEERNKILLEALIKFKDWEDDKISAIYQYPNNTLAPGS